MDSIIGALSNAIRGAQWRTWLRLDDDQYAYISSDFLNALIFALTVWWHTEFVLALLSFGAMLLGAKPGWGSYISATLGSNKIDPENKYIDKLIARMSHRPVLWGMAGLGFRGLFWGACLAVPFLMFGYYSNGWLFVIAGACMPLAYWLAGKWIETRQGARSTNMAWGLGEIFFGAILWSPL